uniref:Thioredoxin-like_fold domain-containing protein n=1 Tax=Angiostrongylus cantonensis TaxID=6313 RepID=A0A0K0DK85_ANGCA
LMKNNWKSDTVYLYQFPRSPVMPNVSPFCLKVETFLRVNDIKYEVIGGFRQRSSRGLLPFIELNGNQIADSQVIIWELQRHFKIKDDLTDVERGTARALERMVDVSTFYCLLEDKCVLNGPAFVNRSVSGVPLPTFVTNFLGKRFSETIRKRVNGVLGRISREELKDLLRRDIQAIDDVLQDKKFLFGPKMTVTDCAVFAQLATTFFLPYRQLVTDFLEDDFPRVRHYVERIRNHYYPEWKYN